MVGSLIADYAISGHGAVSVLYYGNQLTQLPLALIGTAVATVVFPLFASPKEDFKDVFQKSLRFVLFLSVPATIGLMVLAEPIVSLLMSHSPVPATGFTCMMLKRDTIELDITVDQALQYIVSCGVVVPPHQQWSNGSQRDIGDNITRHIEETTDNARRLIESA
jgi:uncharacterized membrane protein